MKISGSASTPTPLSDALPAALGVASAGVSASVSRDDHVHVAPAVTALGKGSATEGQTLKIVGGVIVGVTLTYGIALRTVDPTFTIDQGTLYSRAT